MKYLSDTDSRFIPDMDEGIIACHWLPITDINKVIIRDHMSGLVEEIYNNPSSKLEL